MQVTKDYRVRRVSDPLRYNDIATASSEGSKDIWTDRERDWDETEAIDTGQNRTRAVRNGSSMRGGARGKQHQNKMKQNTKQEGH